MEEKTDGKKSSFPSIPANYVSILQLQERWNNERARKRKEEEEEEERRRKLQVEENLKKAEEEKLLDRSNRKNLGRYKKKESVYSGEVRCVVEKEELEVTAASGSGGGEGAVVTSNEGLLPEKMRGRRKRYDRRKKKKQDVAVVVEDVVVDCGCGSVVAAENNTPVKDEIPVCRKKKEKSTGEKRVKSREKAVKAIETQFEDLSIRRGETKNLKAIEAQFKDLSIKRGETKNLKAIETQFEDLSIKRGETKNLKARTRSIKPKQHVRMPIGAASTMVWVKKEQNERAGDGIASGVKPLKA